jgi:hypothetical protein
MSKRDNYSFADVRRAANSSMNAVPVGGSRDRVGLVNSGNPDVLAEAVERPLPEERPQRLRSGPAWHTGLRAGTKAGKTRIEQP